MTHVQTSSRERGGNQRLDPRVRLAGTVQLQYAAGPQLGRLTDLSLGGVGARIADPPAPGTYVNVALGLEEGRRLDLLSVVARCDEVVGLRFEVLTAAERTALRSLIRRCASRS